MAELLFQQPKPYQPKAEATSVIDEQFKGALSDRLNTVYSDLANKYENKQISDTDFSSLLESNINQIPDEGIRSEWQPKLTEAKYMVFKNAQSIEDTKIKTDYANEKISVQETADRYIKLAEAAEAQDSVTADMDGAAWRLAAASLLEAERSRGRTGGGVNNDKLLEMQRKYEFSQFQLGIDKSVTEETIAGIEDDYKNGLITEDQKNIAVKQAWSNYYASSSEFLLDSELMDYTMYVNPEGGYNDIYSEIDYVKSNYGTEPIYFSQYLTGLSNIQTQTQSEVIPTEAVQTMETYKNLSEESPYQVGQSKQEIKPVAYETYRRSNPLNL